MFYLRCRHGDTGKNVMFHNKDGCGYGTNLDKLHLFTLEEAQKELNHDIKSLPLLASTVDSMAIRSVDMQVIDADKDVILQSVDNILNTANKYVVQIDGHWNGNDIYFKCDGGEGCADQTYDFDKAKQYDFVDAFNIQRDNYSAVMWSIPYLETKARRTFQSHNINTRKMVTGPGIKYKKPPKPRPTTGKTRYNCNACGKMMWEYDPYMEEGYCSRFCEPLGWS